MSLAENLLNSLDETAYQNSRIVGIQPEEEHIIVGQDRVITVPNVLKIIAVKGDKDIETATIDCVRYWDGHDLSSFAIYLNYILPNGDEGTYIPKSITKSEDFFSFDWQIGSEFTYAQGKLTFWIVAKLTDDNGVLIKQWSSFQNSDCTIAQGGDKIYVPEKQTDQDVISQAISVSRESAETAQQQANLAIEAADKAALDASQAAEEEVSRIIGELGVVQELGNSPNSVISQAKITKELENANAKIELNHKRIMNLEQGIIPEPFETDNSVAYVKDVPENALPYAEIVKVGGMTHKCNNLFNQDRFFTGRGFTKQSDGSWLCNTLHMSVFTPTVSGKMYFKVTAKSTGAHTSTPFKIQVRYSDGTDEDVCSLANSQADWITISGSSNSSKTISSIYFTCGGSTGTRGTHYIKDLIFSYSDVPYEPYYEGLKDTAVTEVKSVGANLFNMSKWIDGASTTRATVERDNNSVTITATSNDGYDVNHNYHIPIQAGKAYTFSFDRNNTNAGDCYVFVNDSTATGYAFVTQGKLLSFVAPYDATFCTVRLGVRNAGDSIKYSNIMINKGATALPYAPYTETSLDIPEAVQALDGYGIGINADYNNNFSYEEDGSVKYTENVKVVDLSTLNWQKASTEGVYYYTGFGANIIPNVGVCSEYQLIPTISATNMPDKSFQINESNKIFYIRDTSITSASEISGTLVYAIPTPEVTDITDLITPDNFIKVEGGGIITAVNEHSKAVPTEITYMVKEVAV